MRNPEPVFAPIFTGEFKDAMQRPVFAILVLAVTAITLALLKSGFPASAAKAPSLNYLWMFELLLLYIGEMPGKGASMWKMLLGGVLFAVFTTVAFYFLETQ